MNDDEETEEVELPNWRFSMWDIVGIFLAGFGGMCMTFGSWMQVFSREFQAMANYKRDRRILREARRKENRNLRQYQRHQREIASKLNQMVELKEETP